ncbi:MAG: ABC transporter ATP-binding protein [Beijerinckiaceae bacterium]|nr:ABC transporter ATP-binding protein [Beijerinckiaceae bacterium]
MVHALELTDIGRRFGALHAVRNVSLTVPSGQRHAILGPNGAGKTTLFNLVCGDFPPTSGRVVAFGEDMTRRPASHRARIGIGRTYQTSLLFTGLTVIDNLLIAIRGARKGRLSLVPSASNGQDIRDATVLAERVRLAHRAHHEVATLSHGQRRQLELGMALACKPRLLMLDEPAAGLSPAERPELNQMLKDLPGEITLVLIEHDMDVALPISDMVTVMKDGEIVVQETPDRITDNPIVNKIYLGQGHG